MITIFSCSWTQTWLCWEMESCAPTENNYSSARQIWYVYSHLYHFYSSSQMKRFNCKTQHNLWGLFTKLPIWSSGVRRHSHQTQSHPPSKSILIQISIKIEHWTTKAWEMFWKACRRYREICKIEKIEITLKGLYWPFFLATGNWWHPFDIHFPQFNINHNIWLCYFLKICKLVLYIESHWPCFSRLHSTWCTLLFQNAN